MQDNVTPSEAPDFLTPEEMAAVMRVNKMTVYRLIRGGALPATRIGRQFRVRREDFALFLDAQSTSAVA